MGRTRASAERMGVDFFADWPIGSELDRDRSIVYAVGMRSHSDVSAAAPIERSGAPDRSTCDSLGQQECCGGS